MRSNSPRLLRRVQMPLAFVALLALAAGYALRPSSPTASGFAPGGWAEALLAPGGWLFGAADRLREDGRSREEFDALRAESERLRTQLEIARGELARWRQGGGGRTVDFAPEFEFLAADVTGTDLSPRRSAVTLNRGSRHGVEPDMPVVAEGRLVGVVRKVSGESCVVQLANDTYFAVAARAEKGRWKAVARGQGAGAALLVEPLLPLARLAKEEVMVCAGGPDSLYPAGLPIGPARGGDADKRGLREILCEPEALRKGAELEFALILTRRTEERRPPLPPSGEASAPGP